jgi:aminoglycoside phosphotransferase (APT) family kinase protein
MWDMSEVQPAPVDRDVVDFAIVGKWMDEQGLPAGEFAGVVPLGGGTQNIMVRFARGGREYVLRRGPKHLRAKSNDVIRREARLLGALAGTGVRAPEVIAACPDESVLGAVFYLMEPVTGFNPQNELPELYAGDPEIRRQMGLSAVEAIARLGAVGLTCGRDGRLSSSACEHWSRFGIGLSSMPPPGWCRPRER